MDRRCDRRRHPRCDGARLRRGGGVAKLYSLDPRQPAGSLTEVATGLGVSPGRLAFDGSRIWTANEGNSVSIVTPGASPPWSATTVDVGHGLAGILYDGANVWATSFGDGVLIELDSNGAVLQTAEVGEGPAFPVFDGANIWVPNETSDSVSIVRASTGAVIRTLTGNGLNVPSNAAFDGERVLVTNLGGTVSLSRAADLAALGSFSTGRRSPSGFAGTA